MAGQNYQQQGAFSTEKASGSSWETSLWLYEFWDGDLWHQAHPLLPPASSSGSEV